MDERTRQAAKHAAGQKSEVRSNGDSGWLGDQMVRKTGTHQEVVVGHDRVKVIDNMVFRNGSYIGPLNG